MTSIGKAGNSILYYGFMLYCYIFNLTIIIVDFYTFTLQASMLNSDIFFADIQVFDSKFARLILLISFDSNLNTVTERNILIPRGTQILIVMGQLIYDHYTLKYSGILKAIVI